jgi:hypothetical protein
LNKAQQEIAEFRNFETLSRSLVQVNQRICQLRPLPEESTSWTAQEKKRQMRSIRKLRGK